ncbi:hypothetical protein ACIRJR_09440 [Streptomyces sp. NPDC102402]|uniref:hypothetical protein n=1 Tax=Streptomyces sp. NPDC102402 TaxID=3366169 RepID=UPI0037FFA826
MDANEIDRRMAEAAQAEEHGQYDQATHLYDRLGKDVRAQCGRFDTRAIDAFEGMARSIHKSTRA